MTKRYITSDLHLGHKSSCKWRPFESPEEHDEVVWDNLRSTVNKRDSIFFLGDIAFTPQWLKKIKELPCKSKVLILGNHDTDNKDCAKLLWESYDQVHSMLNYKGTILSHCPIHESEFRGKTLNVHGHLHEKVILTIKTKKVRGDYGYWIDKPYNEGNNRYFNVCLEHTEYKPLNFEIIKDFIKGRS